MQRRKLIIGVAAVASVGLLSACRTVSLAEPEGVSGGLAPEQLRNVIIKALLNRSWRVTEDEPGLIKARYIKGPHIAAVVIHYNEKGYRIEMDPATTLKRPDGMVDAKFNQWVRNIDKDIGIGINTFHL